MFWPRDHKSCAPAKSASRKLCSSAGVTSASSEAPISRTYSFQTSAMRCSGISREGSDTASYSAWARRWRMPRVIQDGGRVSAKLFGDFVNEGAGVGLGVNAAGKVVDFERELTIAFHTGAELRGQ